MMECDAKLLVSVNEKLYLGIPTTQGGEVGVESVTLDPLREYFFNQKKNH